VRCGFTKLKDVCSVVTGKQGDKKCIRVLVPEFVFPFSRQSASDKLVQLGIFKTMGAHIKGVEIRTTRVVPSKPL